MEMHFVDSSNLESVGYDPDTNTLAIEFKKSGTYHYHDVLENVFRELLAASSPGTYFNENVKHRYTASKM
jgi:microcystin degradation protein MlrC